MSNDNSKIYMEVISEKIKASILLTTSDGTGAVFNRVYNSLRDNYHLITEDLELSSIEAFFGLFIAVFNERRRVDLLYVIIPEIIEGLTIDDGIKKGLKIISRDLSHDKITSDGQHLVEAEKVVKEIPILRELGADVSGVFINALQSNYSYLLFEKYADLLNAFLTKMADSLDKSDTDGVLKLIVNEIQKIHLENKQIGFRKQ